MMRSLSSVGILLCLCFALTSCESTMSPIKVNQTLPNLTEMEFINQVEAEELVESNKCQYLVKERTYAAPLGFTLKEELRSAAKGIDEWVQIDGGNAYVLRSYNWTRVGSAGSTQLYVDFDTMTCY